MKKSPGKVGREKEMKITEVFRLGGGDYGHSHGDHWGGWGHHWGGWDRGWGDWGHWGSWGGWCK
jgi:hypothetical protein